MRGGCSWRELEAMKLRHKTEDCLTAYRLVVRMEVEEWKKRVREEGGTELEGETGAAL